MRQPRPPDAMASSNRSSRLQLVRPGAEGCPPTSKCLPEGVWQAWWVEQPQRRHQASTNLSRQLRVTRVRLRGRWGVLLAGLQQGLRNKDSPQLREAKCPITGGMVVSGGDP